MKLLWVFGFGIVGTCVAVKAKVPDKAPAAGGGGSGSTINQILGIKGAKQETVSYLYAFFSPFPTRFWMCFYASKLCN